MITECTAAIARGEDVPLGFVMDTWMLIAAGLVVVAVVAVVVIVVMWRHRVESVVSEEVPSKKRSAVHDD